MKGNILAGGHGTRLYPITLTVSKQLMPVYDKPMIYYPISTLMQTGIKEILIISTPEDLPIFEKLLGNGSHIGCNFSYVSQAEPKGLAHAFIVGEKFIGKDSVVLILGDNIFHGSGLKAKLQECKKPDGGIIFAYPVQDPQRYGVVDFDKKGNAISLQEKPKKPKSNYAIPGIYFYDNNVIRIAKKIKPSKRGELEITDINKRLLKKNKLKVKMLDRGTAWLDTGTFNSLMQASQFVQAIQERQGLRIGAIEEVALQMGYITKSEYKKLSKPFKKSGYSKKYD